MALHDYRPRTRYWLGVLAEAGLPHLRPEAQELIAEGWRAEDYKISVRVAELHLLGVGKELTPKEKKMLSSAPETLRTAVLYAVGEEAPPPTYLGTGSGWSWGESSGPPWSPGAGVDAEADRRVRDSWRPKTPPFQLELDLLDR